jgi:hypothetical protein
MVFLVLALTGLLLLSACKSDKKKDTGGSSAGETPAAGQTPAAGGETPTAPPSDGGDNADGSASLELSGDLSGSLDLAGLSCDFLGGATDTYGASISGTVDGSQLTIDVGASKSDTIGVVKLTRTGGDYAKWDNSTPGSAGLEARADSGTVTISDDGGELSVQVAAAEIDPGSAAGSVNIDGGWTCPGGMYQRH